jgi:hypothetical protein
MLPVLSTSRLKIAKVSWKTNEVKSSTWNGDSNTPLRCNWVTVLGLGVVFANNNKKSSIEKKIYVIF